MNRNFGMMKDRIWKGKLHALLIVVLASATTLILSSGCAGSTYTQTIKVTAEPINVSGLVTRIEYYQDRELVNSIHFIDGNGDGVIDGKSGPSEESHWPRGWEWFDDMYRDVIVGHSTIVVVGEKIKIQNRTTYEFLTGKYECEQVG